MSDNFFKACTHSSLAHKKYIIYFWIDFGPNQLVLFNQDPPSRIFKKVQSPEASVSGNKKTKTLKVKLYLLCFAILASCGKKEKECNPLCGYEQTCDDGVCKCKTNQYIIGNSCISKCKACFEGSVSCGCTDKYILNTTEFENGVVRFNHAITGTIAINDGLANTIKIGASKYKFTIKRSCPVGDRIATYIEFLVDNSDSLQLKVDARYHILPSNETLATCSAVFTR